eukprot:g38873.t1
MAGEGGVFGVVNPFGWRLRNTVFSLFRSDMVLGGFMNECWGSMCRRAVGEQTRPTARLHIEPQHSFINPPFRQEKQKLVFSNHTRIQPPTPMARSNMFFSLHRRVKLLGHNIGQAQGPRSTHNQYSLTCHLTMQNTCDVVTNTAQKACASQ